MTNMIRVLGLLLGLALVLTPYPHSNVRADEAGMEEGGPPPGGPGRAGPRRGRMEMGRKGGNDENWSKLLRIVNGPDSVLEMKETSSGISIVITSADAQVASRIKKIGEIIRLNHELEKEERAEMRKKIEEKKKKRKSGDE